VGGNSSLGCLHRSWNRHRFANCAQAGKLSSAKQPSCRTERGWPHRTHPVHARMDAGSRTPTPSSSRAQQRREARNALARAVFFSRQGELRDRTFESQRYRASGLNLVVLAIILWNTIYLERAINALRQPGIAFPDSLLTHVSPIGWEHINLTGDYTWHPNRRVSQGRFRPLRPVGVPGVPTTVHEASS